MDVKNTIKKNKIKNRKIYKKLIIFYIDKKDKKTGMGYKKHGYIKLSKKVNRN